MVRLMQKERLKSPQKSPILKKNRAIWVILAILAKTVILVILASHFRDGVDLPEKKFHLESSLDQPDKVAPAFVSGQSSVAESLKTSDAHGGVRDRALGYVDAGRHA